MNTSIKGFNSLGVTVDTETDEFTVTDVTFGTYKLKVIDSNKPLWYGNYVGGKLAIFMAGMTPLEPTGIPCYGLVFVIAEQPDSKMDSVGCVLCGMKVSIPQALESLLFNVKDTLINTAMADKNNMVTHGRATLH